MIRLIRKISAQLIIRECFFSNTNRTNLTNLLGRDMVCIREIRGQEPAASGNACKSVYNPFASKKNKVKKNPWSKTPCASVIIRERFF